MYSEAERRIFGPYFDGTQMRYADPLRVNRLLAAELKGDLEEVSQKANSEDPEERSVNRELLVAAARSAFELLPFDPLTGTGSLEIDALAVYNAFQEWLEKNESREPSLPTLPQPTDSPASSPVHYPTPPTSPYTSPFPGTVTGRR